MLAIKRGQSMAEFVNSSACVCVSVCMLARVCVCCACLCATDATLKAHSAQRQRTEIVEKVQQSRAAYVPQVRANKMAAAQTNHKQQQWPTMTQALARQRGHNENRRQHRAANGGWTGIVGLGGRSSVSSV